MSALNEPASHNRTRGRPRAVEKTAIRDEVRDPPRTPQAVAHGRSRKRKGNIDPYYIDPRIIPQDWTYEWKTKSVYGEIKTSHMVGLMENGWTAVPSERHEGLFMPPGYRGDIERDGLVLMERPKELTEEARYEEVAAARQNVQAQKEQLGLAMPSGFNTAHRGVRPQVNTSYEAGFQHGGHKLAIE